MPPPLGGGVGILAVERRGHLNAAPAVGQVSFMDRLDSSQMLLNRLLERFGKHRDPVFRTLAVADENLGETRGTLVQREVVFVLRTEKAPGFCS